MSKFNDVLHLEVSVEDGELACRKAVADIGWRILQDDIGRLVVKEVSSSAVSLTWAAKVELVVEDGNPGSLVRANGSISGMGPIQKGHLKGQVGALLNRIDLRADESTQTDRLQSSPTGLAAEIERLVALRDSGALTQEEFSAAKLKAIENS